MLDLQELGTEHASQVEPDDAYWAQHDARVEQCYAGQWVVPFGRLIVAHGADLAAVLEDAERATGLSRDELVACAIPQPQDWLADA